MARWQNTELNVGILVTSLETCPFSRFGEMIGGYGEEVQEADQIQPALRRAREAIAKTGKCAVVNVWIDPNEYAPGTKAQTMYK